MLSSALIMKEDIEMDIVYKKKDRIAFKAIAIGDVFSHGGALYMSTP